MKTILLVTGLTTIATLLMAQDAPVPHSPVPVIVTVEARHGKDVPLLTREDFLAYERKDRVQVMDVLPLQGEHAGLELFILIDDSSSSSLGLQLDDLRQFIQGQPATTAIGIGYMSNGTFNIAQNFTADHSQAAQRLRLPLSSFGVMASPWLSLGDLIKRWPGNSVRREVILVSSGVDQLGGLGSTNPYLDIAIEAAQRSGIVVYAIYTPGAGHAGHSMWGMNWAQNHLAQLAEETGGESYMLGFGEPVSFRPYLAGIAERLSHQYRVTLDLKAGNKAGFQAVRFVTEVPNAELVGASKVFVPASGH